MDLQGIPQLFILVAFITANIPWLSDRFLVVFSIRNKNGWLRWLEWVLLYGLVGLLAVGLERKLTGVWYDQDWEFYVTNLCLFIVFALPGFIFHYDLKKHIWRKSSH